MKTGWKGKNKTYVFPPLCELDLRVTLVVDMEKFLFIEIFQLVSEEGMIESSPLIDLGIYPWHKRDKQSEIVYLVMEVNNCTRKVALQNEKRT